MMPPSCPVETFPVLDGLASVRAAFLQRSPEVDVLTDRDTALARLESVHRRAADENGFRGMPLATAEQVHGAMVAEVGRVPGGAVEGADGLMTAAHGVCLAIYVADCAAVYLADKQGRAIALVHSGKKGTEQGIVPRAIQQMEARFGIMPGDLVVQISPCIRPPHYEVDIAAEIIQQARNCGVAQVVDCGTCTASDPVRYYSYRREKGKTGRLLALMALR